MYTIEVTLKSISSTTVSVQRKELDDAKVLYGELLATLRGENGGLVELTCEDQEDKKVAFLGADVMAVQMTGKGRATSSGRRPPGFLAAELEGDDKKDGED
ncbi:MAG: hypothetical protein AAF685_15860 [Cyanobacteria bacterium P01_C01_bin.89]